MTSPAIHILSEPDQKLITKMATIICEQQREYFVSHTKRDKSMEFYKMNLNGFGAELAFCRLAKVEFDESVIENENHFKSTNHLFSFLPILSNCFRFQKLKLEYRRLSL